MGSANMSLCFNHNGVRVYIAKITFTTLIDHFTSLCHLALVYSNQLIKLSF